MLMLEDEIKMIENRHTIGQIIANDSHRIIKYDDGEPLSAEIELFTADHNATDLQMLMQDGSKLIFRYSELHCNACVDSMVVKLREYAKEVGPEKVNIWASYRNNRDYFLFLRLNPVYIVLSTTLSLDSLVEPFMFVLSPDLHISHIYIPHKEYPGPTYKYLEDIKHLL